MGNYTILFNNGREIDVPETVIKAIHDNIMKGCPQFHVIVDENQKIYLIANLSEITCIKESVKPCS